MRLRIDTLARRLFALATLQIGIALIGAALSGTSMAEKLVDPTAVAPEYREAAEKRRAEQMKLFQCSQKAEAAKLPRRDRAAFVNECLEK
jgi:hypothetical protein